MKVIGIDPGLADTGVGCIDGDGSNVVAYSFGAITTESCMPIGERLSIIYSRILAFLHSQQPDLVVLEDIFSLARYPRSSILLGKVSGVLLLAAFTAGVPIEELPVREAKRVISGSGRADKVQVEASVRFLLGHPEPIRPFHASDALALALAGFYRYGKQQ